MISFPHANLLLGNYFESIWCVSLICLQDNTVISKEYFDMTSIPPNNPIEYEKEGEK